MSELHEMNSHLQSIDKRLDRHIGVVEVILENQQHYMEELKDGLKEQRVQFIDAIHDLTINHNERLSAQYYNKTEIDAIKFFVISQGNKDRRSEITEAVNRVDSVISEKIKAVEKGGKILATVVATVLTLVLATVEVIGGVL